LQCYIKNNKFIQWIQRCTHTSEVKKLQNFKISNFYKHLMPNVWLAKSQTSWVALIERYPRCSHKNSQFIPAWCFVRGQYSHEILFSPLKIGGKCFVIVWNWVSTSIWPEGVNPFFWAVGQVVTYIFDVVMNKFHLNFYGWKYLVIVIAFLIESCLLCSKFHG